MATSAQVTWVPPWPAAGACRETTMTVWPSARRPVISASLALPLLRSTFGCSPPTLVVGLLAAPKATRDVACWASRPQSTKPTMVLVTNWMMVAPPGEPVAMRNSPRVPSAAVRNSSVGAIELRGRLPAATRLAMGAPVESVGEAEKSVSWLFSRKPPRVMWKAPKPDSMVVVIDTTLPRPSTTVICVVPFSGDGPCTPVGVAVASGPAVAVPMLRVRSIRPARLRR